MTNREDWLTVRVDELEGGTLGVPLALRREPTEKDFADPRFDVLWELMRRVDVDHGNGHLSDATGNDVCAILDALDAAALVEAEATAEIVAYFVEHLRDEYLSSCMPVKSVARRIREEFVDSTGTGSGNGERE